MFAIAEHGPCHWKAVSEYVRTKGPRKCELHYIHVFLQSATAPFADHVAFEALPSEAPSPAPMPTTTPSKGGKRSRKSKGKGKSKGNAEKKDNNEKNKSLSPDPDMDAVDDEPEDDEERSVRKISPPNNKGALEGFNKFRGDFDVEWDDTAEEIIADLEITPSDNEEEVELKFRLTQMYDERLRRREAVKQFVFDRKLLDFPSLQNPDRRCARDEKELSARLQIFSRLLPPAEFRAFHESILAEYRTAKELTRATESRDTAGMRYIREMDSYDVERKNRAIALNKAKVRLSTPTPSPTSDPKDIETLDLERVPQSAAQASVDSDNGKPVVTDSAKPVVDNAVTPVKEDGRLLDGESDKPSVVAKGKPSASENGSPLVGEKRKRPLSVPDEVVDAGESKCTIQRKARELRRINRSPYPLLDAMPIDGLQREVELTTAEATLCCTLHISPEEFLHFRDAMLAKAKKDHELSDGSSSSTNCHVRAFRASRETGSENNLGVDVVCKRIPRSSVVASQLTSEVREVVGGRVCPVPELTIQSSVKPRREASVEIVTTDVIVDGAGPGDVVAGYLPPARFCGDEAAEGKEKGVLPPSPDADIVEISNDSSVDPSRDAVKNDTPSVVEVEVVKVVKSGKKNKKRNKKSLSDVQEITSSATNTPAEGNESSSSFGNGCNDVQEMETSVPNGCKDVVVEISSSGAEGMEEAKDGACSNVADAVDGRESDSSDNDESSDLPQPPSTALKVPRPSTAVKVPRQVTEFIVDEVVDGGDGETGTLGAAMVHIEPAVNESGDSSELYIPKRKRSRKALGEDLPPKRKRKRQFIVQVPETAHDAPDGYGSPNQGCDTEVPSEPATPNSNGSDEYVPSPRGESSQRETRRSSRRSRAAVPVATPTRKSVRLSKRKVSTDVPETPVSKSAKRTRARKSNLAPQTSPARVSPSEPPVGKISKQRTRPTPKKRTQEGHPESKKTKARRYSLRRNR